MPVWVWQASLRNVHSADTREGAASAGDNVRTLLLNMLMCAHISVEIIGRSARAFSRAARMLETMEFGFSRSTR